MFHRIRRVLQQLSLLASSDATSGFNIEEVLLYRRQMLAAYRDRLRSGSTSGRHWKAAVFARRRFARSKTRKLAKALRAGAKRSHLPKTMLLNAYRPSPILDNLLPGRKERWVHVLKRKQIDDPPEVLLKNFSIIEHPRETLASIKDLAGIAGHALYAQIHFDDDHCVDISPYLILAEVWPAISHVFKGGRISTPIQKVVEAVRLRSPLGMKFNQASSSRDVWAYPLHRRRPSKISRSVDRNLEPQTREKVADGFCDAVDEWLGITANFELTPDGKARFAMLMGELLDNAERHSDLNKDGTWSIAAFMARRQEGDDIVFRCYMAFLSEGVSIAEGLETAAPTIKAEVSKYCDRHARRGQSRDTLATLMALQDTITRDAKATAGDRGGIGLQDVLEFVTAISGSSDIQRAPRLTIVSGRSCIQLRPPYMLGQRSGPNAPRLLWCNLQNDPKAPPDTDFVFDLEDHFAGTIVGLSFVLDPDHLRKSVNA